MSRNAIAFLAGLGTGFVEKKEKEKEDARKDREEARASELHDSRMQEHRDAQRRKQVLADSNTPTTVTESPATLDFTGTEVQYPDADLANSDFREVRGMAEKTDTPIAVTPPKQSFAAGGVQYQDRASAEAGAKAYNTPEAGQTRAVAAMRGIGEHQTANTMERDARKDKTDKLTYEQSMRAEAYRLLNEGAIQASPLMRQGDLAGVVAAFNTSGQHKIVGTPKVVEEMRDIESIGPRKTYTYTLDIQNPDGSVATRTFNSHDMSMKLMPFEKYLEHERQMMLDKERKAGNQRATERHNLDMQVGQLDLDKKAEETKLPAAVKMQADAVTSDLKKIGEAIVKAQAEGLWDATSPGSKQLLERQAALNLKLQKMLDPYATKQDKATSPPDPIGLRSKSAGSEATAIAQGMGGLNGLPTKASGKPVSFKSTPEEKDIPRVLQTALSDANAALESAKAEGNAKAVHRAQSDIDEITTEMSKAGITPSNTQAQPAAKPISKPAPKPAQKPNAATASAISPEIMQKVASPNAMVANSAAAEMGTAFRNSPEGLEAARKPAIKQQAIQIASKDPQVMRMQAEIQKFMRANKTAEMNNVRQALSKYLQENHPAAL